MITEIPPRPSPADIWSALAICGYCEGPAQLLDPMVFEAPRERLPPPLTSDGKRAIIGALYFRDPFHAGLPFENYCGAACSLARHDAPEPAMTALHDQSLDDLIARLEAATEGSLELNYAIYREINEHARNWLPEYPPGDLPGYTESVDAAMTLVPEFAFVRTGPAGATAGCNGYRCPTTAAEAKTPALALCIACLRAIAASRGKG